MFRSPLGPAGPQPRRARLPRAVQTAAGQFGAAALGPAGPQPRRARLPRPVQTAAGQFGAAGLGPLRAAGSSMADARSAAQPSLPPRSPLGQQSRRLPKRAFKRTAQPAGPCPCWRPPLGGGRVPRLQTALRQFGRGERAELCEAAARQGLGGSETFKGCQRPLRRGYLALENRSDYSHAT